MISIFFHSTFDQNEFFDGDAKSGGLDDEGFIFIPQRCVNGSNQCHLHINFHGCGVEKSWLGDGYVQRLGFLPLAEDNDVILMFPQIKHSLLNPNGCWDWWGYLGDAPLFHYATKQGKQMIGVARMIERMAGIEMF